MISVILEHCRGLQLHCGILFLFFDIFSRRTSCQPCDNIVFIGAGKLRRFFDGHRAVFAVSVDNRLHTAAYVRYIGYIGDALVHTDDADNRHFYTVDNDIAFIPKVTRVTVRIAERKGCDDAVPFRFPQVVAILSAI